MRGTPLHQQHWPDGRVWAHVIPHGLPDYSDIGTGVSNAYGDLYPLDLVQGGADVAMRPTSGVPRALQAGITGVQILQFGNNRGSDFVTEWMAQADPTWSDYNPYNDFMVAPCLKIDNSDDAVRLIQEYAQVALGRPSAATINGKLIYYVYGPRALSPTQWQGVRERLGLLNNSVYLIADLETNTSQTGYELQTSFTDPYFPVFEASFVFDDSVQFIWNELVAHLNRYDRQFVGGMEPGLDRQTCELDDACGHIDAQGTARYRDLWGLALDTGGSWQTVLTWNDMVERTEVEATSNWNRTRADVTAFYSSKLRGIPFPRPQAELYVTTPQMVRLGEPVAAEGLVLNGSTRGVRVTTVLLDNRGEPVGAEAVADVAPGTAHAAVTSGDIPVISIPPGRFLRARTSVADTATGRLLQSVISAPVVVYASDAEPTKNLHRLYYSIPAAKALPGRPLLKLSGSPTTSSSASATVTAPANTSVRFSEVLQNTRQVANGFTSSPFTVGVPMVDRKIIGGQITSSSPEGFYVGRVIDENERVGYTDPVYVPER